jgi:hypothetical protein
LATLVKTVLGKWKAVIRKAGWPTASKSFSHEARRRRFDETH